MIKRAYFVSGEPLVFGGRMVTKNRIKKDLSDYMTSHSFDNVLELIRYLIDLLPKQSVKDLAFLSSAEKAWLFLQSQKTCSGRQG